MTLLNPLATLARGYAVVRNPQDRQIISSGRQVNPGDSLLLQLRDATLSCRVEKVESTKSL